MNKEELKKRLEALLKDNAEFFLETINEVFTNEWLQEQEEELLFVNFYSHDLIKFLKDKIDKEIGKKYSISPSKFSVLLNVFLQAEIIEKGCNKEKIKQFKNNPQLLDGIKEVIKYFDKEEGEDW